MRQFFNRALLNLKHFGDTDVFPFPVEKRIFEDQRAEVVELLEYIHSNFDEAQSEVPIRSDKSLAAVGYTGFRAATQIEPVWNVYLLALVLSIGEEIEAVRLPESDRAVYSYRFSSDKRNKRVFKKGVGWSQFQSRSRSLAKTCDFVLKTDISDFYPRIYHHRLENELRRATTNTEAGRRIMRILNELSGGASYGLPVGGPAARLLSELVLNRMDRILRAKNVRFVRFVDDYRLFADSERDAYAGLVTLSEGLLRNEGLSLQKTKTRILSANEFLETSDFLEESDPSKLARTQRFLAVNLHYDPYSPTSDEDYRDLKAKLAEFDVLGMLTRELEKTQVHETLAKRLVGVVKHLEPAVQASAVETLSENLEVLHPLIPAVFRVFQAVCRDLDPDLRERVFERVRRLVTERSRVFEVPVNLHYAIRLLALDRSADADIALQAAFDRTSSESARRDVIVAMAKRRALDWLGDRLRLYDDADPWSKRALLMSSFLLGDEGRYRRDRLVGHGLSRMEVLSLDWARARHANNSLEDAL